MTPTCPVATLPFRHTQVHMTTLSMTPITMDTVGLLRLHIFPLSHHRHLVVLQAMIARTKPSLPPVRQEHIGIQTHLLATQTTPQSTPDMSMTTRP